MGVTDAVETAVAEAPSAERGQEGQSVSSVPENATVLLIGASRGLGYAIAEEYIGRGS